MHSDVTNNYFSSMQHGSLTVEIMEKSYDAYN